MIEAIRIVERREDGSVSRVVESYSPDRFSVQFITDTGEQLDVVRVDDKLQVETSRG